MIQLSEKEFAILIEIINRSPKTAGEMYALETIVNKVQAQVDQAKQEQIQKAQ